MAKLLPQSVCTRAELLSRSHTDQTVAELLGIAKSTLWHMQRRGWQSASTTRPLRPMPGDFQIQSKYMKRDEMARHYRASNSTVTRWMRELRARG